MHRGAGIAGKFLQYLAILCVGFGVSYYFSWEADRSNKRMLADIKAISLPVHDHSSKVALYTGELIRLYERAVITEDEEALENSGALIAKIKSNLTEIANIYSIDSPVHERILKAQEQFDSYALSSEALSRKLISGQVSLVDVHDELEEQSTLVKMVIGETDRLKDESHEQILRSIDNSRLNIERTKKITIWIFWIILGMVVVFFFLVRSTILNPVLAISATSQKATKGNFDYVATKPPNNEIGILIANFNNMILKIKRNRNQLTAIEKESQRLSSCGSFKALVQAIPESITRVTLGEVDETGLAMYFRNTCFIEDDLEEGFYQWQDGRWHLANPEALSGVEGGEHIQPIRDPRTGRVIGIMACTLSEDTPEETYKAVEVLANPVANAVAAIMLEQATRIIQRKKDEMTLVFDNIDQGIFVTDESLTVGPSYSPCLEDITDSSELSGKPILDNVFFGVSSEIKKNIETVILCSLGEDQALGFDCNAGMLPAEFSRDVGDDTQIVQAKWVPIVDSSDVVCEIMVCLEDVTAIRKLETQREANRAEMKRVYRLLKMGDKNFVGFVRSSERYYQRLAEISGMEITSIGVIEKLKLELHKHKGTARVLGMFDLATAAHDMEDTIMSMSGSQKNQLAAMISSYCTTSMAMLSEYKESYTELLGKSLDSREKLFDIETLRFYMDKWHSAHLIGDHDHFSSYLKAREQGWTDLSSIVREIQESFKKSRHVTIRVNDMLDDNFMLEGHDQVIRDCLVHLFNNSIDHGKILETDSVVELWQSASDCGKFTTYHYKDNGAGLNLEAIRRKLRDRGQKNVDTMPLNELANQIFTNGLSSRDKVSETSGRGVGMDVVRHAIESLFGEVEIQLLSDGDSERQAFQVNMTFPASFICSIDDVVSGVALERILNAAKKAASKKAA